MAAKVEQSDDDDDAAVVGGHVNKVRLGRVLQRGEQGGDELVFGPENKRDAGGTCTPSTMKSDGV